MFSGPNVTVSVCLLKIIQFRNQGIVIILRDMGQADVWFAGLFVFGGWCFWDGVKYSRSFIHILV